MNANLLSSELDIDNRNELQELLSEYFLSSEKNDGYRWFSRKNINIDFNSRFIQTSNKKLSYKGFEGWLTKNSNTKLLSMLSRSDKDNGEGKEEKFQSKNILTLGKKVFNIESDDEILKLLLQQAYTEIISVFGRNNTLENFSTQTKENFMKNF